MIEGLNRTPSSAPPKLRLNSVLNSVTRRGPFLGNSAGVIAMVYNGVNSTIGYYRGRHDSANSVVAGALSGMLFKSTRGLRPMLISGGLVASAAGTWAVGSTLLFDQLREMNLLANDQVNVGYEKSNILRAEPSETSISHKFSLVTHRNRIFINKAAYSHLSTSITLSPIYFYADIHLVEHLHSKGCRIMYIINNPV